jgi:hypothetical protein
MNGLLFAFGWLLVIFYAPTVFLWGGALPWLSLIVGVLMLVLRHRRIKAGVEDK